MIRTPLMQQQNLIVTFCEPKSYAGIFSDYGTGKTLAALALIQLRKFKKTLVVATRLAIETTWMDQIREHSDFRFVVLEGTAKQKVNLLDYAVGKVHNPDRFTHHLESNRPMLFLINYEGIESIYRELIAARFDAIIADESTKIKTFDSKRTLALQEVGLKVPNRYIMTGFPVTEAIFELYSQVKFLDGGETFGHSYYHFINKYFVRTGPKTIVKAKALKEILNKIKPFCIRITNKHLKLPPVLYKPIEVHMTEQQRELLKKLNDTFRLELGAIKIDTKYIFALLSKSLQICDGFLQQIEYEVDEEGKKTNKIISSNLEVVETNKDEALLETLDDMDIHKNKVVIWAAFLFSVRKIKTILEKCRVPVLTLTGANEQVNKTVQMFQKSSDYNVIICTQKMAAESVTLTSAKYAIYYSNLWSNDLRLNSEARIRRIGSEKHDSILYADLVTKNTIEKKVYECLRKKKNLIDELKTAFLQMKPEGT